MMEKQNVIIMRSHDFGALVEHLYADTAKEAMAIGYYRLSTTESSKRILVQGLSLPTVEDYAVRTPSLVSLGGEFLQNCFDRCEEDGLSIVDIHTHPWQEGARFSGIDDNEAREVKGPYLKQYLPEVNITYALFGSTPSDLRVRMWDSRDCEFVNVELAITW